MGDGDAARDVPHVPVMRDEALALLAPRPGGTYVDLTAGAGGHLEALLDASGPDGVCIGLDRDADALATCTARLGRFASRLHLVQGNARDIKVLFRSTLGDRARPVDGVIVDAGVSSMQLDRADRGFSFRRDGPLDMRMDRSRGPTAADLVNGGTEASLAEVIATFGEERHARRVARVIVARRATRPFLTTTDLAEVVARAVPASHGPGAIHPATRTFQALRIAVNDEIDALRAAVMASIDLLAPGGRLVVIAFHSLEDRVVKRAFQDAAGRCSCPPGLPVCVCGARVRARILTPRPLVPSDAEVATNPRSRSARLRAVELLGTPAP